MGFNYRIHALELKRSILKEPIVFMKSSMSIIGLEDYIVLPKTSRRVDYEVGLAFVIEKRRKIYKKRSLRLHFRIYDFERHNC